MGLALGNLKVFVQNVAGNLETDVLSQDKVFITIP
jgi:hypothetical protein